MTELRWYEEQSSGSRIALTAVLSNGRHVYLGWLMGTDDGGWEYVHSTWEIISVIDLPGLSLEEAKAAAETMVRLKCALTEE